MLISDGEDHRSLPLEAAQMLGMLQISLSTVGVGDPNRSVPIPLAAGDNGSGYLVHNGAEVLSQMRSGLLVGMAEAAGGVYLGGRPNRPGSINGMPSTWPASRSAISRPPPTRTLSPQYGYFVLLAVVLLVAMIMRRAPGETA